MEIKMQKIKETKTLQNHLKYLIEALVWGKKTKYLLNLNNKKDINI